MKKQLPKILPFGNIGEKKVGDIMHYNGPIVRPPTDAYSVMLEITVGCTHDKCKYCNFYKGFPFKMADLNQIEMDLKEVASIDAKVKDVWAAGGNPFALSVNRLESIALLVRKYLPEARISTYARVNDFKDKSIEDIRHLKELGFEDILIGVESGDDKVLVSMNKGYTGADVFEQLRKVEAAGVDYRVIYLGGIAGAGECEKSAKITADVFNQLHPYMIFLTSVALLPGTQLYEEARNGKFVEPSELERIIELRTLLANMENDIFVYSRSVSSFVDFTADLPNDKIKVLKMLDDIINNFSKSNEFELKQKRDRITNV